MCIPGISEEFLLHVYCKFENESLGIVFISTSDEDAAFNSFSDCATGLFNEIKSTGLMNHIASWGTKCFEPINMQEITCAIIRNNFNNQYVAYNLPSPSSYTNEEFNLLSRFEDMYSWSLAHTKKHMYIIEWDEGETYVMYWKTGNLNSYTFLLWIDEWISNGKDIEDICKTLLEELKSPKKSTFINKFS